MAYTKSKFVESAQKLLNQGKVPQAIAEYQQILKFEPRDQVTLMTIGELYIRQGETFQAIDYFERLAQIFVGDGFLTKAIAVYKRIAKLAPEEIRPLEKLADLYVQQGVMSEARPLFLQLAEIHLKNNRQPEAVGLLKKLLLAEPDNLRIQIRLADLYQAMGQSREAVDTYVSAAQRALARGDQAESDKLADKALKIDANCLAATIVKARSFSSQGNLTQAAEILEHVPDLDKGGEQTELLLDLYLKNANWDKATALALRVLGADSKNFGPAQKIVESLLESGQSDRAMAIIGKIRVPMIDGGEHEVIGRLQNELAGRMPGRLEPLEWLVDFYGRTSDSFRLPDALAHLGDALVAANQPERAKAIFEQLVDRQPDSDSAKRKLDGVLRKLGLLGAEAAPPPPEEDLQAEIPKAPAPKLRPDAEATFAPVAGDTPAAPSVPAEPQLDEETQKFIAQSLTDVDLFASYGLTQKAIGLLEAILRRAPRHTPTLEKLLDFVLGAGDDRRTAELASQLEQIHVERADLRGAERFGELRRRFQRAAGLTDAELAASTAAQQEPPAATIPEVPMMEVTAEPEPAVEEPAIEFDSPVPAEPAPPETVEANASSSVQEEVDLSDEWDSMLEDSHPAEPAVKPPPARPAAPVPAPPHEVAAEPVAAEEFSISEEPVAAAPSGSHEVSEFELPVEEPAALEEAPNSFADISAEIPRAPEAKSVPATAKESHEPAVPEKPPVPEKPVPPAAIEPEPEFELDQDFELVLEQEPLVPAYDQKPPATPIVVREPAPEPEPAHNAKDAAAPPAGGFASDQFLADLAKEIDDLGLDALTPSHSEAALPAAPPKAEEKPTGPVEHSPLKEVFDDFRAELGEMGAEDEDLETHYNLGIAFREMGLVDEAISEFQKVAKATENGKPFRYVMQCCTLLGLAFTEKGQPGIAAIWYERALLVPGIEPESILALRYDLGVAQESAGEPEAALKSFSQVYAMNIDYRDVADRIAALQKPIR
ncbi:MAG TPA: tetratricopeptide repeat protein [Verrucomicrobiae bacterium]|jgi:tetratricopeptide (TPR) repeat protein|nr:tetratricopeptide repeat protein [Verrucomicrobiae bacterium]